MALDTTLECPPFLAFGSAKRPHIHFYRMKIAPPRPGSRALATAVAPAELDSVRLQQAQLQFAALQRQQQAFSTEIDQLLTDSTPQEAEQSTPRRVGLGVAGALLLLLLAGLLRARLIARRGVVPPA